MEVVVVVAFAQTMCVEVRRELVEVGGADTTVECVGIVVSEDIGRYADGGAGAGINSTRSRRLVSLSFVYGLERL